LPKLIFRGAFVRFVDLRYDEKSKTVYTKINFTAAFSDPIRQAMEWGEPPAGFASAKLDGEFTATNLILTPNGRELKQHEIQLSAKEISGFDLVRVKSEDGESTSNELRFQVISQDPEAAYKLREYLAVIGKGEAQMRVGYEAQSELEMEAEDAEERMISQEQAEDTAEEDGPALAPAVLMGGSHQKGTRNKKRSEPVN
jgi:hypothetical protein